MVESTQRHPAGVRHRPFDASRWRPHHRLGHLLLSRRVSSFVRRRRSRSAPRGDRVSVADRLTGRFRRNEFDLEALRILEERRIVVGSACPGPPVLVQRNPTAVRRCCSQLIDAVATACVEGEMAESGKPAVVTTDARCRFEDQISRASHPAPAVRPLLVELVPQFAKQPRHASDAVERSFVRSSMWWSAPISAISPSWSAPERPVRDG